MMQSLVRQAASVVRTAANIQTTQCRGTCIFRRMYPPRLYKKGKTKALKRREYVYILEENLLCTPLGDMEVILLRDIEGLGFAGDQLQVPKMLARQSLMPADLAVYATAENFAKTEHLREARKSLPRMSIWAQKTARKLKHMNLPIPMNPNISWTLNKTHVRVAFRAVSVMMTDDCIVLPVEPVTEPGDITLTVIINGVDKVPVKATVYPFYSDPREAPGGVLPVIPEVWADTSVSIEDIAVEHARTLSPSPPVSSR